MLVALTKCDVPGARPQEVRTELLAEGLELVDAGGNIQAYIRPCHSSPQIIERCGSTPKESLCLVV